MMNMQNMMKQAQKLQKQMEKSQAELAATTFTGKSAQDLVVAELTGDKKVVNITFADAVVDPDDVETLQDMTVQALNDALGQIDEATKKVSELGKRIDKVSFIKLVEEYKKTGRIRVFLLSHYWGAVSLLLYIMAELLNEYIEKGIVRFLFIV